MTALDNAFNADIVVALLCDQVLYWKCGLFDDGDDGDDASLAERLDGSSAVNRVGVRPSDSYVVTISGLQRDTAYRFVLQGTNVVGVGPMSPPSPPIRTLGPPTGPHSLVLMLVE